MVCPSRAKKHKAIHNRENTEQNDSTSDNTYCVYSHSTAGKPLKTGQIMTKGYAPLLDHSDSNGGGVVERNRFSSKPLPYFSYETQP